VFLTLTGRSLRESAVAGPDQPDADGIASSEPDLEQHAPILQEAS
jgi:hypothetical protein